MFPFHLPHGLRMGMYTLLLVALLLGRAQAIICSLKTKCYTFVPINLQRTVSKISLMFSYEWWAVQECSVYHELLIETLSHNQNIKHVYSNNVIQSSINTVITIP